MGGATTNDAIRDRAAVNPVTTGGKEGLGQSNVSRASDIADRGDDLDCGNACRCQRYIEGCIGREATLPWPDWRMPERAPIYSGISATPIVADRQRRWVRPASTASRVRARARIEYGNTRRRPRRAAAARKACPARRCGHRATP